MAKSPVKFYSVSNLPQNPTDGAIYFVGNGELYKGSQRFGLAKVYTYNTLTNYEGEGDAPKVWNDNSEWTSLSDVTGMARGDLAIGDGAAKVYDGAAWQPMGADSTITDDLASRVEAIESHVIVSQNLISATTGSFTNLSADSATFSATTLNATSMSVGGKSIEQIAKEVGESIFATGDADGQVKFGSTPATVNGWSTVKDDITFLKGVVTSQTEGAETTTKVTADVGEFNNIIVDGTASFVATTVSATTLTIGGSTVEQLADKQIAAIPASTVTASSNGIEVSVTTSGGNVTNVTVNAAAFANVMHFKGVVNASTHSESLEGYEVGDVILIGPDANIGWENSTGKLIPGEKEAKEGFTPATLGQEYICVDVDQDGHIKWELIGDQNTGATKRYVDTAISTAMSYSSTTGVAASASTLSEAAQAAISAIDGKVTSFAQGEYNAETDADKLVTAGAVWGQISQLGTAATANVLTFGQKEGEAGDESWADKSQSNDIPTASQVYQLVTDSSIVNASTIAYEAPVGAGVTSSATTVSEAINALDTAVASALTSIDAINTSLASLGAAAYKSVATSIGPSLSIPAQGAEPSIPAASDDNLATEKAVRDAIEAARTEFQLVWYDDEDAAGNEGE